MENDEIRKDQVETLFSTRYISVYDLHYAAGKHYYDASRRKAEDLAAVKTDPEFREMRPDAVTCAVILKTEGKPDRLLLSYEYRYPVGRFVLSPPAGLIDPEDGSGEEALLSAARREIREETGIPVGAEDRVFVVSPLLFSTPGMTDESNALVCAVVTLPSEEILSQTGGSGSERFDGFVLADREEAMKLLQDGTDSRGIYYSVFTWAVLMFFVSGIPGKG